MWYSGSISLLLWRRLKPNSGSYMSFNGVINQTLFYFCIFVLNCTIFTGNKMQLVNFSIARRGTWLILVYRQFFTLIPNYCNTQKYNYKLNYFYTCLYNSDVAGLINHNKSVDILTYSRIYLKSIRNCCLSKWF